jgi:2-isopropylmalate synthase
METEHSFELPRGLQVDFAQKVQAVTDLRGGELTADELLAEFRLHYLSDGGPYELGAYTHTSDGDTSRLVASVTVEGVAQEVSGSGNGPIAALVDAFEQSFGITVRIADYHEHAMAAAADATAAAYIEADVDGDLVWGVGLHSSIVTASLRAVVCAVNRALAQRKALAEAAALFG